MKFTYDFIKENLRIYNEAKSLLPIISQYENEEVSYNAMRSLKLELFADFHNFLKSERSNGFELIQAISFKEIKAVIIDKTKNERFKTLIKNMSQKTFTKLLTEDAEKFDRYLNGRWISKPGYNSRGRRTYGKRSNESIEGLNFGFTPLINWVISNEIETIENDTKTFQSFSSQDVYSHKMKWYKYSILKIDTLPMKEIGVTSNLLNSLVNFIQESEIDFRKLNSDFIVETIQNKVRKLMNVPTGTTIVSLVDLKNDYGRQVLTKGKNYTVINSTINYGFIKVYIQDDVSIGSYYDYKLFEDISLQRDMLLQQLGILD
jgi:hypothetical protein